MWQQRSGPSDAEKAAIIVRCEHFIGTVLKPRFLPEIRPMPFNYPVDILGKWRGTKYRFLQRYRSGFPENLGQEFESPFVRLDWVSRDRFDLQWYRHTETWFCLHQNLSLDDALKTIETDGHLHPL